MLWNPASSASHRFILSAFSRVSTSPVLNAKRDRDHENLLTFPIYLRAACQPANRRLTGHYILENVLDPSAAVAREYTLTNVATTDGRLISGIIREQNDRAMTIQTANERIVLPREDIEEVKPSTVSMMPEGQLERSPNPCLRLSSQEIRDLFAYLAASQQVPVPAPAR